MTQTANTKVWDRDAVQHLIATNDLATSRALWRLYQRQTTDEQASNTTKHRNARGFNGRDAEFLSSIAAKLPRYDMHMTPRQIARVRPMLRKYWRQLLEEIELKGGQVNYKVKEAEEEVAETPAPAVTPERTFEPASQYGLF